MFDAEFTFVCLPLPSSLCPSQVRCIFGHTIFFHGPTFNENLASNSSFSNRPIYYWRPLYCTVEMLLLLPHFSFYFVFWDYLSALTEMEMLKSLSFIFSVAVVESENSVSVEFTFGEGVIAHVLLSREPND
ncbi:hypothetical protein KSP39_PZI017504 [Platanthera zijinensis]|uniref:Uncharacterized protein n=1 Tax=Platanthera zijinensis TaxID=2320716 RepID=A0AAP0B4V5_9ASPA